LHLPIIHRDINKAVNNNPDKFPAGYVVELSKQQKGELVENFHRFNKEEEKMKNIFARSVPNELKSLPIDFGERLLKRIESVITNVRPAGSKKLCGRKINLVSIFWPCALNLAP
jgi:hypothetical protein